jgi:hypothetical protein
MRALQAQACVAGAAAARRQAGARVRRARARGDESDGTAPAPLWKTCGKLFGTRHRAGRKQDALRMKPKLLAASARAAPRREMLCAALRATKRKARVAGACGRSGEMRLSRDSLLRLCLPRVTPVFDL